MPQVGMQTLLAVKAVMERGSVSLAAKSLGISQPAVSMHLRRFEDCYGYSPVSRVGNKMMIKDHEAKATITEIIKLESRLRSAKKSRSNHSRRLGFCSYISPVIFSSPAFNIDTTSYTIISSSSKNLERLFDDGAVDGIFTAASDKADFDFVRPIRFGWYGASSFATQSRNASYNIVTPTPSTGIYNAATSSMGVSIDLANVIAEVDNCILAVEIARSSALQAFIPEKYAAKCNLAYLKYSKAVSVPYSFLIDSKRVSFGEAERVFERICASLDGSIQDKCA